VKQQGFFRAFQVNMARKLLANGSQAKRDSSNAFHPTFATSRDVSGEAFTGSN
jgi:hypothetical protein